MAELTSRLKKMFSGKPFALWVIFGGLLYFGLVLLGVLVPVVVGDPKLLASPILDVILIFAGLFVLGAFLGLTGKRWALVVATALSIAFLVFLAPIIAEVLSNPADMSFGLVISGIPALTLVTVFSILSLVNFKKGIATRKYLASPVSLGGLFAMAVLGFVIGGLLVGSVAAILIGQLLEGGGEAADVRIVRNAALAYGSGQVPYDPVAYTIRRGDTVVWYNADTATHTVTSNDTGLFDSGNMGSGARFAHTFPDTGTFEYHCTPHIGSMWATIVVTP